MATIGMDRLGAAPQDNGVAGLEAQGRRIGGHIGTRLVDDADDPQRDAHLAHHQVVGALPHPGDFTHRVGQGGHLAQGVGHTGDALFIQHQTVQHGGGKPFLPARFQVLGIFSDKMGRLLQESSGHGQQHIVFGCG